MDRGAWQAMDHGVAENRTRLKQLSMQACMQSSKNFANCLNLFKEQIVGFIDFFYSSPLLHFTVSTLVFIFSLFLIALGFVFSSFFVS